MYRSCTASTSRQALRFIRTSSEAGPSRLNASLVAVQTAPSFAAVQGTSPRYFSSTPCNCQDSTNKPSPTPAPLPPPPPHNAFLKGIEDALEAATAPRPPNSPPSPPARRQVSKRPKTVDKRVASPPEEITSKESPTDPKGTTCFIQGFDEKVDAKQLRQEVMAALGMESGISTVRIARHREDQRSRGFGFIVLPTPELASQLITQGLKVNGRSCIVSYSTSEPRPKASFDDLMTTVDVSQVERPGKLALATSTSFESLEPLSEKDKMDLYTVIVQRMPTSVDARTLREEVLVALDLHKGVRHVRIVKDEQGKSKGFGFVTLPSASHAAQLVARGHLTLLGRRCRIQHAMTPTIQKQSQGASHPLRLPGALSDNVPTRTIWIGGLPPDLELVKLHRELNKLFIDPFRPPTQYKVVNGVNRAIRTRGPRLAKLMIPHATGNGRRTGVAYVVFRDGKMARKVVEKEKVWKIGNKVLMVDYAMKKVEMDDEVEEGRRLSRGEKALFEDEDPALFE